MPAVSDRELSMLYQSTMEAIVPGMQNAIFKPTPFLDYILSLKTTSRVGERIRVQLEMEKSTNFQYYRDYETLNVTPQKGVRSAYYDWSTWATGVTISRREEKLNKLAGAKKIFDLITQKSENAIKAASEQLDADFMTNSGEPTPSGDIPMTGLYTLVGDHLSSVTTVGELSAVDYSWWRSRIHRNADGNNPGADLPVAGEGQVLTLFGIDKMIDDLDEDGKKPGRAFLRTDIKRALIAILMQENQPIMSNADLTLRTGFDNIVYRGVTFQTSRQITTYPITGRTDVASDIFWLPGDSNGLELTVIPEEWMAKTDWREPTNQMAKIMFVLGMGNLIATNRRWLGKTEKVARAA